MFSRQFPESLPMEVGPTIDPISMDSHDSMHASDTILRKGNDGNEDIPLLPRQTKVLVVGNNRTKAAHIGLHGVVKKSVGLGGWHWLVLENGQEVRLQRNALNVIEIGPREDQVCELASNLPTCLEYDPYLVKAEMSSEDEDTIPEGGPGSGPMDKTRPKRCPKPRQLYDGEGRPQAAHIHQTRVNFRKLDTVALQRYSKHYGLEDIGPNSSKEQLASAVLQHFESQDVDEASVIAAFMQAVRKVQHRNHRKPSHHFKPRLPRHSLPCA